MTDTLLTTKLTLPEALMAFLHNEEGQVYGSARPRQLAAAAELGELVLEGYVTLTDRSIVAGSPVAAGARPWMADVITDLPEKPVQIDGWIRKRHESVKVQQVAAREQGVLMKDRAKLAGVIGYDRHMVDDGIRDAILSELESPQAPSEPRAQALAKLLMTPGLKRVLRFDAPRIERLTSLAASTDATPLPGPLFTAMDYGIATAIGVTVLGD